LRNIRGHGLEGSVSHVHQDGISGEDVLQSIAREIACDNGSIAPRPCKERKDGAPTVAVVSTFVGIS